MCKNYIIGRGTDGKSRVTDRDGWKAGYMTIDGMVLETANTR